jgi:hypothetical protein
MPTYSELHDLFSTVSDITSEDDTFGRDFLRRMILDGFGEMGWVVMGLLSLSHRLRTSDGRI